MANHIRDIFAWMVSTIQNDSAMNALGYTKVYAYKAPEDATYPYIILEKQTGAHNYNLGIEAFTRHWITVKSINFGTDGGDNGRQAQDRIKVLFNNQVPTITSGGYTMLVRANTDFEFVEAEAGNFQFYYIGTVYVVHLAG